MPDDHRQAVDLILRKLGRIRLQYVLNQGGPLQADQQWAVRVIDSLMRRVEREWHAKYGSGRVRETAALELDLGLDQGQLLEFLQRKHRVGCFDCPACSRTDNGSTLSQLCSFCHRGVMHAVVGLYDTATQAPVLYTGQTQEAVHKLQQAGEQRLFYRCDGCGRTIVQFYTPG